MRFSIRAFIACLGVFVAFCSDSHQLFAQSKTRLSREQTQAAEFIESVPKLRDELDTALFKELKRDLPSRKIGGTTYFFVEGDIRLNEDQLLLYAEKLNHQYAKWRAMQSMPAAVREMVMDQQFAELAAEKEGGKVVRWKPGSTITYCVMKKSFGTGQEAEANYSQVVTEIKQAADAWSNISNASVPPFKHVTELDDSPLSSTPAAVTFAVWSLDLPGTVIASAFFPNDPQENWHVLVDPDAYFGDGLQFDRVGVLRHELGHTLGFRHEHPRSEAPLVCKTLEVFDQDVIPLGDYDPVSVMHYFCRGFNNPGQQALNEQRRKLLLTDIDRQGTRLVYPPEGQTSGFEFLEFDPVRQSPTALLAATEKPMMHAANALEGMPVAENALESVEGTSGPWEEPQDSAAAINDPDDYAWKLFVALNWPADTAKREADSTRDFGDNATTVWESWKFSSGANDEVFLSTGADPGAWLSGAGAQEGTRNAKDFEIVPLQLRAGLPKDAHLQFDPSTSTNGLNENHLNEAAYEFIRDHELYNIEGQEKLYADANALFKQAQSENRTVAPHEYKLHFPLDAKEVKAQWRPISVEDKSRYRWVEFTDSDGSKLLYGLTALHITTKDIPNWLWATFEHVDNPKRENASQWETPTIDSAAGPDGYPVGMGIEGTRWENYRLRGTQVDFVDSFGEPTILANSQIEDGFQHTSSCITCHARTTIGPRVANQPGANRLSIFKSMNRVGDGSFLPIGSVGPLQPDVFIQRTFDNPITGDLKYLQLDFVWSLMRAQRKASGPIAGDVTFNEHIKPLFRQKDVDSMKSVFDLGKHSDVSQHADAIFSRLDDGSMPCDVPWSAANVDLFRKWIEQGKKE